MLGIINISKLLIDTKTQNAFSWESFWTALFGAGFGALSAYWLNQLYEIQKRKDSENNSIKTLVLLLCSLKNTLFSYKEQSLDEKLTAFDKKDWVNATKRFLGNLNLPINSNEYIFFANKSHVIYALLLEVINYINLFELAQNSHDEFVISFKSRTEQDEITETESLILKSHLDTLEKTFDLLLYFTDRLFNMLLLYNNKFPYKAEKINGEELPEKYKKMIISPEKYFLESWEKEINKFEKLPSKKRATIYNIIPKIFILKIFPFLLFFIPDWIYKIFSKKGGK